MTLAIDRAARRSVGMRNLALAVAMIAWPAAYPALAEPAVPQGVWLTASRAAVQIYDCEGLMCGKTKTLVRVPLETTDGWCWAGIPAWRDRTSVLDLKFASLLDQVVSEPQIQNAH